MSCPEPLNSSQHFTLRAPLSPDSHVSSDKRLPRAHSPGKTGNPHFADEGTETQRDDGAGSGPMTAKWHRRLEPRCPGHSLVPLSPHTSSRWFLASTSCLETAPKLERGSRSAPEAELPPSWGSGVPPHHGAGPFSGMISLSSIPSPDTLCGWIWASLP